MRSRAGFFARLGASISAFGQKIKKLLPKACVSDTTTTNVQSNTPSPHLAPLTVITVTPPAAPPVVTSSTTTAKAGPPAVRVAFVSTDNTVETKNPARNSSSSQKYASAVSASATTPDEDDDFTTPFSPRSGNGAAVHPYIATGAEKRATPLSVSSTVATTATTPSNDTQVAVSTSPATTPKSQEDDDNLMTTHYHRGRHTRFAFKPDEIRRMQERVLASSAPRTNTMSPSNTASSATQPVAQTSPVATTPSSKRPIVPPVNISSVQHTIAPPSPNRSGRTVVVPGLKLPGNNLSVVGFHDIQQSARAHTAHADNSNVPTTTQKQYVTMGVVPKHQGSDTRSKTPPPPASTTPRRPLASTGLLYNRAEPPKPLTAQQQGLRTTPSPRQLLRTLTAANAASASPAISVTTTTVVLSGQTEIPVLREEAVSLPIPLPPPFNLPTSTTAMLGSSLAPPAPRKRARSLSPERKTANNGLLTLHSGLAASPPVSARLEKGQSSAGIANRIAAELRVMNNIAESGRSSPHRGGRRLPPITDKKSETQAIRTEGKHHRTRSRTN